MSTNPSATPIEKRAAQKAAAPQVLVRLCQSTNYGCVRGLKVKDTDPIFDPLPQVLVDVKLDADEGPRPEVDLTDFVLRDEVCRLMQQLDRVGDGCLDLIEI